MANQRSLTKLMEHVRACTPQGCVCGACRVYRSMNTQPAIDPKQYERLRIALNGAMSSFPFSAGMGHKFLSKAEKSPEEMVTNAIEFLTAIKETINDYVDRQNKANVEANSDRALIFGFGRLLRRADELAGNK